MATAARTISVPEQIAGAVHKVIFIEVLFYIVHALGCTKSGVMWLVRVIFFFK